MSLGKAVEDNAANDPLVQAVEEVWDAGIVVVCSAGNYGRDGNFSITSPGNSPKVITVGSITDKGTGTDFSDDFPPPTRRAGRRSSTTTSSPISWRRATD